MNSQNTNFWQGFQHAGAGIVYAFRSQRNFRVHLLIALLVVIVGLWLGLSLAAWAILVLTIGVVLVAEVVNTAIEIVVDLVSPDYHLLAKRAKDLAGGAVLLMALTAVGVGLIILGPPLLARLLITQVGL